MRTTTIAAAALATAGLLLTGCGEPAAKDTPAPASSQAAPTEKGLDAEQVSKNLAQAIPEMKTTVVYTETSDPNKRMGRPHQYTSKTAFTDSRIDKAAAKQDADGRDDAIVYGGTVEVFPEDADAKKWLDNIDKVTSELGALLKPDYLYRHGNVVIRVSSHLAPSQAREYEAALTDFGSSG